MVCGRHRHGRAPTKPPESRIMKVYAKWWHVLLSSWVCYGRGKGIKWGHTMGNTEEEQPPQLWAVSLSHCLHIMPKPQMGGQGQKPPKTHGKSLRQVGRGGHIWMVKEADRGRRVSLSFKSSLFIKMSHGIQTGKAEEEM